MKNECDITVSHHGSLREPEYRNSQLKQQTSTGATQDRSWPHKHIPADHLRAGRIAAYRNPASIATTATTVLTATVKAVSCTNAPLGTVSFQLGNTVLGTAPLVASGSSAAASITFAGTSLVVGNNSGTSATKLTRITINNANYSQCITSWFGTSQTAAGGHIAGTPSANGLAAGSTETFAFSDTGPNGRTWSATAAVP